VFSAGRYREQEQRRDIQDLFTTTYAERFLIMVPDSPLSIMILLRVERAAPPLLALTPRVISLSPIFR